VVRALHRGGLISEREMVDALRALGQAPTVVAAPSTPEEQELERGPEPTGEASLPPPPLEPEPEAAEPSEPTL
jgi:hypothetical protein